MFKEILNLEGVSVLSKNEMKSVDGGRSLSLDAGSDCAVYVKRPDGSGYWSAKSYSVAEAQFLFNGNWTYNDGSKVTGYCCASC